jgi:hypothetical protein
MDCRLWRAQWGRRRTAPEVGRSAETLFHGGHKAIASTGHGLDVTLRLSAITNGAARGSNTPFQGRVTHTPLGPQVLEQLVAQHHTLTVLQQVGKRAKYFGLKPYPYPCAAEFIQRHIEGIVVKDVEHGLPCLHFTTFSANNHPMMLLHGQVECSSTTKNTLFEAKKPDVKLIFC